MSPHIATLSELAAKLTDMPGHRLAFQAPTGRTGKGYAITEIKRATVESIDCGRSIHSRQEAYIQLLDSEFGKPVTVDTLIAIIEKSNHALAGVAEAPVFVEFSPKNNGLQIFRMSSIDIGQDIVLITLSPTQAACRPFQEALAKVASCCGTSKPLPI